MTDMDSEVDADVDTDPDPIDPEQARYEAQIGLSETLMSAVRSYTETRCDLECLLCGRALGFLLRYDSGPLVWFSPDPGAKPRAVFDTARIRCTTCGGTAIPGDITSRLVRIESREDLFTKPRKGRPPKWLVEERLRKLAALAAPLAS